MGYRTHYGWKLGESGQWSGASQQFQEVLQKDPEKKDAYQGLSQARLFTGDYAGAREAASEGLNRFPDDPGLLTLLGEALAADEPPKQRPSGIMSVSRPWTPKMKSRRAPGPPVFELGDLNAGQRILEEYVARTLIMPRPVYPGQMNLWADAYGVAAQNFRQVLKQEPDNQEARQNLDKCETFLKPQIQVQGGFFEDSETFRSAYMLPARVFISPRPYGLRPAMAI